MKKIFASVMACALALFLICGCNSVVAERAEQVSPENSLTETVGERFGQEVKLRREELIAFHNHGEKYPAGFAFPELASAGYERVVGSASTAEEACEVVREHFNSGYCKTVVSELRAQTDCYFGVYAKWAYYQNGDFTKEPTSYYDELVVSFNKSKYDAENERFFTKDEGEIKQILDYLYYSRSYNLWGYKVYKSNLTRKSGKFEYEIYALEVCYGDWGIQDELSFVKETRAVDWMTGKAGAAKEELLQTVYVDGDGIKYGGMFE